MHRKAYAKINPVLNIICKRPDSYHEIDTLMQSITLADDVYIEKEDSGIFIDCGDVIFENNIAYVAAKSFFENSKISGGVRIKIEKHIPVAAGLGGGSSDAAAVLSGLNDLYDRPLEFSKLLKISEKIGADVPFCLMNSAARARGIGEILDPVNLENEFNVLILKTEDKPATGNMYKAFDVAYNPPHPDVENFISAYINSDFSKMKEYGGNSFDCLWDFSEIYKLLYDLGSCYAGLSGSGPSVFAFFESENDVIRAANNLCELGECFICKTI